MSRPIITSQSMLCILYLQTDTWFLFYHFSHAANFPVTKTYATAADCLTTKAPRSMVLMTMKPLGK